MAELTEVKALEVLAYNVKRKRRDVDLLTMAECCSYLENLYGSRKEVARRAGATTETIRVYGLASSLPKEVKPLVRQRLIDKPEVVEAILRIRGMNRQIDAAKAVIAHNLKTSDVRDVEKFARSNPDMPIEKCVSRVLESKPRVKRRYVVITELQESTLQLLVGKAQRSSITKEELVKSTLKGLGVSSISCDIRGKLLMLTLEEAGFMMLKAKARELGVPLEILPETVISKELTGAS